MARRRSVRGGPAAPNRPAFADRGYILDVDRYRARSQCRAPADRRGNGLGV
ncbi:hypothetical protein GCM10009730_50720 [Streptomyces albidochromogenes]